MSKVPLHDPASNDIPITAPERCEQGLEENYPNTKPVVSSFPDEEWAFAVPHSVVAYAAFAESIAFLILWYTGAHGYGETTVICPSFFLCLSYLATVIEGWSPKVNSFLGNVTQAADFLRKHERLKQTVPTIIMRATAHNHIYHGDNPRAYKKVTYSEQCYFAFSKCIDVSGPMQHFQSSTIYRIESEKTWGFLNQQTADRFEQIQTDMIGRARSKGIVSLYTWLCIPNFEQWDTVYTEEDSRTKFMSRYIYRLLNFFLCSWPYRIFFWYSTKKRNYTYLKLISL